MGHRLSPLLLALAGLDIASGRTPYRITDAPDPIRFDPIPPTPPPSPLDARCPVCDAAPGAPCDPTRLGKAGRKGRTTHKGR